MAGLKTDKKTVLVGVLKSRRDLGILLKEKWYRIPVAFLPKRRFTHIAFYQPAVFGRNGKRIEYYGKISRRKTQRRMRLLPEKDHPRAHDDYLKLEFREIRRTPKPIKNVVPRRIYFGFTTLENLFSARNILELYHVPPTEQIVGRALRRHGIRNKPEFPVTVKGRRFRLDFAIEGGKKPIAIECDNTKAHTGKLRRRKDRAKDKFLCEHGWKVIRLKEPEIISDAQKCNARVRKSIQKLGGQGVS